MYKGKNGVRIAHKKENGGKSEEAKSPLLLHALHLRVKLPASKRVSVRTGVSRCRAHSAVLVLPEQVVANLRQHLPDGLSAWE